jgi:glycosyltransferase involved in cell wall biosynthesis
MRIGVDVRELLGRPTGVGRYLLHLLREWNLAARAAAFPHQLVLYAPAAWMPENASAFDSLSVERRVVPGASGSWWEQVQLPSAAARDRLDVLFAPAYTAPLRLSVPVVQTIHDLSFLAHPEWFTLRERVRRRWITRASARRARIVLTDSRFSADELFTRLAIPHDRIRVIRLGLTTPGRFITPGVISQSSGPTFRERPPTVLYVGSIFNRRRVPDLIRAFAQIAADIPGARLEIVGENRTHPSQDLAALCRRLDIADRVGIRAYVSDDELVGLYSKARAFAFLSEYEGFGLTPLEALSCGIPVVLLDTPVARETCGPAASYVGLGDTEAVAMHLRRLLTDEGAHRDALAPADAVLAQYRWADAARATLGALESAARSRS